MASGTPRTCPRHIYIGEHLVVVIFYVGLAWSGQHHLVMSECIVCIVCMINNQMIQISQCEQAGRAVGTAPD